MSQQVWVWELSTGRCRSLLLLSHLAHIRNESVILRFLETPRRTLPITLGHYVRNFSNPNSPNKRRGCVGAGSFAKMLVYYVYFGIPAVKYYFANWGSCVYVVYQFTELLTQSLVTPFKWRWKKFKRKYRGFAAADKAWRWGALFERNVLDNVCGDDL